MANSFFEPWVGRNYGSNDSRFPKRILILGESCYQRASQKPLDAQFSITSIREQIRGDDKRKFWTNIAIAFLNKRPSLLEKEEFWESVAFANFVQVVVGSGPRVRPQDHMWATGEKAFISLLDKLHPQCVIVLGFASWHHLPTTSISPGPVIVGASRPQTRFYPLPYGQRALAYAIRHPAAGFSAWHEHKFIQQAIELA